MTTKMLEGTFAYKEGSSIKLLPQDKFSLLEI